MSSTQNDVEIQPNRIAFEFLDAKLIHLFRAPYGSVRMAIEGHDRCYLKVIIAMAYPLSEPNRYIGFMDAQGEDIGTIRDISDLDPDEQEIVREELNRRYFLPKIEQILQLNHEYEFTYIKALTDRGIRDFSIRGHRESCPEISPGRFLLEDIDGNRFEIPDIQKLDRRSRSLLSQII